MFRKQVNAQSPLRIFHKSIHGGLGKGNLGLVMARAGVGKTACLVQIALDDLMRERPVLHITLEQNVAHVVSWYDALFADLVQQNDLKDAALVHASVQKNRMITGFADHDFWPERFEKAVAMFREHQELAPAMILIDGYHWSTYAVSQNCENVKAFKNRAKALGAELWMSGQTHRETTGHHPTSIPSPFCDYQEYVDVAIFLEPHNSDVLVRFLKDHDNVSPPPTSLHLHPDTFRLVAELDERSESQLL